MGVLFLKFNKLDFRYYSKFTSELYYYIRMHLYIVVTGMYMFYLLFFSVEMIISSNF